MPGPSIGHAATPDAEALLKHSDTYRNGWPAYTLRVKITNFESGKSDEESLYEVSQKGTDKTYVEFMSPRDKGRHLLMLGDDMWIYLPDTSRPVRITPLERLSGDASNGDIARTNYAVDYTAAYVRDEKVGNENCYVLDLTAKRKGATYQRILYWVRVEDARPVRAEFYLTSGKHIKSATFDEYAPFGGKMLLQPPHALRRDPPQLAQRSRVLQRCASRSARQALLPGPLRQVLVMISVHRLAVLIFMAACAPVHAQDPPPAPKRLP